MTKDRGRSLATDRSTKTQVQAYRFGVQRLKDAVATGQSYRRTLNAPRHGTALLIGVLIAAVGLAGMAVYGIIKPAPSVGDALVLVDTDSGVPYVVRDKTLHPATNLASAMLAADTGDGDVPVRSQSQIVRRVNAESIKDMARGSLLGIPDAPGAIPDDTHQLDSRWTVCDESLSDPGRPPGATRSLRTTVAIGETSGASTPPAETAHLVTADNGKTTYLLMGGQRSKIDPKDPRLALGLGLDQNRMRPISLGLLNAIPERSEITAPKISDQGKSTSIGQRQLAVGDIIRIEQTTTKNQYFLVHGNGIQEVNAVTADMVRAVTGQHADVPAVPPSDVAAAARAPQPIDTSAFPQVRPALVDASQAPVLCLDWSTENNAVTRTVYTTRTVPMPAGAHPVEVPAKSTSSTAQRVYVRPGWGLVVGPGPDGVTANAGNPVLITDRGMQFPIPDSRTLHLLGLGQRIQPVTSDLMNLLPQGPTLDPRAALRFAPTQAGSTPADPSPTATSPAVSPSSSVTTTAPSTTGSPSSSVSTTAAPTPGSSSGTSPASRTGSPAATTPRRTPTP
ncbi:type VII secretion protein EccB [Austwickia sp. TVS 96-490-7B]|uniref:type VII secretion protein EccB n=1 Tax=Austwickia sp. TVS 96-490-7B TaxID=2830843 RepID=UPI001C581270|nr:type VII secretion protein EccB [Austwickia sp. TVS 96-490-7B]